MTQRDRPADGVEFTSGVTPPGSPGGSPDKGKRPIDSPVAFLRTRRDQNLSKAARAGASTMPYAPTLQAGDAPSTINLGSADDHTWSPQAATIENPQPPLGLGRMIENPQPPLGLGQMLCLCAAWCGIAALCAILLPAYKFPNHVWVPLSLVLLNTYLCFSSDDRPRRWWLSCRALAPAASGLIFVLYDLGIIDPAWFPYSGCPQGASKLDPDVASSGSSGADCGIQEWRKGEYGDCVLIALEVLFIGALLSSTPFVKALRFRWWDWWQIAKVQGKACEYLMPLFFLAIIVGGCANRMRGGWRPFGADDSLVNQWIDGRMNMAVPTAGLVLALSGQPVLALMICFGTLIGSEPGWGCYFGACSAPIPWCSTNASAIAALQYLLPASCVAVEQEWVGLARTV